ncbi:MAG: hypothetical protein AAF610_04725 [Pseudomonadota bacterium]
MMYLHTVFELALVLACVAMMVQRHRDHRQSTANEAHLAQLEGIVHRLAREQRDADRTIAEHIAALRRVDARTDALESRAGGAPRIESARRIAREGRATQDLLKELGLSATEASLLLRLNQDTVPDTVSKDATVNEDTPADSRGGFSDQAAQLARLIANRKCGSGKDQTAPSGPVPKPTFDAESLAFSAASLASRR